MIKQTSDIYYQVLSSTSYTHNTDFLLFSSTSMYYEFCDKYLKKGNLKISATSYCDGLAHRVGVKRGSLNSENSLRAGGPK